MDVADFCYRIREILTFFLSHPLLRDLPEVICGGCTVFFGVLCGFVNRWQSVLLVA